MQKTLKRIWNGVTTAIIVVLLLIAAALWGVRLFGYDVLVVQSGSMEPAYHVGSLVYVKETELEELEVGDVITFRLGGSALGTHRIVDIVEEEGEREFITKGDANDIEDGAPVRESNIVGKVRFSIPYLGYLIVGIQQPPGSYFALCAVAVILLITILPELIFPDKKEKKKEDKR